MDTPPSDRSDHDQVPRKADGDTPPPPQQTPDSVESSYFEKLLLLIPADMVAGYLALDGILKQNLADITPIIYWAVFIAMLALTPLYIWFRPGENALKQVCSLRYRAVSGTISFAVWVFALGGPFAVTFLWYKPVYGSLLLIVTTLALPVFEKIASRYNT
jgi:hypothetical protein